MRKGMEELMFNILPVVIIILMKYTVMEKSVKLGFLEFELMSAVSH